MSLSFDACNRISNKSREDTGPPAPGGIAASLNALYGHWSACTRNILYLPKDNVAAVDEKVDARVDDDEKVVDGDHVARPVRKVCKGVGITIIWFFNSSIHVQSPPSPRIPTLRGPWGCFPYLRAEEKLHCDCTARNINLHPKGNLSPNVGILGVNSIDINFGPKMGPRCQIENWPIGRPWQAFIHWQNWPENGPENCSEIFYVN